MRESKSKWLTFLFSGLMGGRTSTSIAPAADVAFEASASCSTQYTAGKGFSLILNFLLPDVQLIISWSLQEAG